MSDLVVLARRFVQLSDELETVRGEIAKAVLNGGGGETPKAPFVRPARQRSGGSQPHPNAQRAEVEDAKVIETLRASPGLRNAEIARKVGRKPNTVSQQLSRLELRGLIIRQDSREGGWSASAAAD